MSDLPYQAEYAKSGRASCKGCKVKIDQGSLRLAAMVQSAFFDGKQPNWYHEDCFFEKQRPKSASDIGKLNTLRHPDQKRVTEKIEQYGSGIVMPVEKGKGKGKKRTANGNASKSALKDFEVEYSKSSRATCRVCELKICKDEVRICKKVFDTEVGQKFGGQPLWHHVKCFAEDRANLLYFAGGEDLTGFKSLSKEDQKMVKDEIKALKSDEVPVKKLKEEPKDEKEELEIEKKMEKQSKLFYKYRDGLRDYTKQQLQDLLEFNNQEITTQGKDALLEMTADSMAFGCLERCTKCSQGQFVLDTYGYKCTGHVTDWTACQNVETKPKRFPFKVPKQYAEMPPFLKYAKKPKVGERLFKPAPMPTNAFIKTEAELKQVKKERPIPPLKNLQFFLYGKLATPKEELKNRILKLGGTVTSKLHDQCAAVISTKKDLERMPDKMMQVKEMDIEVVEESFLDLIDKDAGTVAGSLQLIKEHNISEWGSDPAKRLPQDVVDGKSMPKSTSMYTKSKSAPTKLKLKGGTAVDPDSGLEDVAHVHTDYEGTKYSVVLGKTDLGSNKNSYYKLQVLASDDNRKCWFFKSWGRIGTKIGDKKVESCKSLEEAIEKFEDCYMERTENPWEFRSTFVKMAGKYCPIEVDYGEEDNKVPLVAHSSSKLPVPVQELVIKIFDVAVMKQVMLEFELDTEKMPLGKLSKKQIKSGYKVLSELLSYIEKAKNSQDVDKVKILDATNRFYTLVPHNFGIEKPPLLEDVEAIKTKTQMLDSLLEIEIAYNLMKNESDDKTVSPVESYYLKLKTDLVPLESSTEEFALLAEYVRNTHASTHSQYTLEIQQIFKAVREGEEKRYKPFRKLHNRRLLWHGSRVTNYAGILSQGLRIAPPEAPVTGYMFGKGIYFADMVSKSANYCCTSKASPVGLMLLSEVALGNMKECYRAENVTRLPAGVHSVWGVGRSQPDPARARTTLDGVLVPCGPPLATPKPNAELLYNEFIVYDVAQVNVKYLFQVKFNYKF